MTTDSDIGYDTDLVFGISWEQPTSNEARKLLHTLGLVSRGFITVGPHPILNEIVVLELGRHVEMEFELQAMACAGHHWANLGDYLNGLLITEDDEDGA
jgi:hypothetical protein